MNRKIVAIMAVLIIGILTITGCTKNSGGAKDSSFDVNTTGVGIVLNGDTNFDKKVDALSYDMILELDTKADSLSEDVTIKIKNNMGEEVTELILRDMTPALHELSREDMGSDPENKDKTSEITGITYNGEPVDIEYSNDKTVIKLSLETPLEPEGEAEINVVMKTDIPVRNDRFGVMKDNNGAIYALSFCFPYLANQADGDWIIDPYFDDGESRSFDLADYKVVFKTDENFKVAASGNNTTENGTTEIIAENCRDFAIVASDMMEVETFEVEGIKVNNYYLTVGDGEEFKTISGLVAKDSIKLFTEKVGPYPYEELDMVPCLFGFAFGGMEYPGIIMNNASSYYQGTLKDAWGLSSVVSHEIAHQWFYSTVGNREYTEGWLDEGFATFLENMYAMNDCEANEYVRTIEPMFPSPEDLRASMEDGLEFAAEEFKNKIYINVSPYEFGPEDFYGEREYTEGYLFLEELRRVMGEEDFEAFLKDYYKEFTFKVSTTDSFLDFLRQHDNSEEVNSLINGYFIDDKNAS